MSHEIQTAVFSAREGAGWTGLGQEIPAEWRSDPDKIAQLLGAQYRVQAAPAFYQNAKGEYVRVPNGVAQVRSDTGAVLSLTSESNYHTDNRQPLDILAAFRDEFAANRMEMSHAAILKGGRIVVACALMDPAFDIVVGKGDRIRRYTTLSTGYDTRNGTVATEGEMRVVCANTWAASISIAERGDGKIGRITASQKIEDGQLAQLIVGGMVQATGVGCIVKGAGARAQLAQRTYNELANAKLSAHEVLRYFSDVLEVNVEDLDRTHADGRPMVSEKMKNLITTLTNDYHNAPGAAIAQGSVWGALNAVTYYATHQKPVRDTKGDGTESARVASNLFGTAAQLKARAVKLALARVKVAA